MPESDTKRLHDAYAAEYDQQVRAYDCYIADVLFGLAYEFTRPGQILLDIGIGSGLSSLQFSSAGLEVHGMDFSLEFLKLCREKQCCATLVQHDILQFPWPYPSNRFDHVVCCGVMHFIPDLEEVFTEAQRVLCVGGNFTFTTRSATGDGDRVDKYVHHTVDSFQIYDHTVAYLATLLKSNGFFSLKTQKSFVGEDIFSIWVNQKHV